MIILNPSVQFARKNQVEKCLLCQHWPCTSFVQYNGLPLQFQHWPCASSLPLCRTDLPQSCQHWPSTGSVRSIQCSTARKKPVLARIGAKTVVCWADGKIAGWPDCRMDYQMAGLPGCWMDGWPDGQMAGWLDGCIYCQMDCSIKCQRAGYTA